MMRLSHTQRRLLEFIRSRHARTGVYPSVREIAAYMGFKSTNTVDYHVGKLEAAGALRRRGRMARNFSLAGGVARPMPRVAARRREEPGLPIVGRVAAGEPVLAEQNFDGLVNFRAFFHCDEQTFALRVQQPRVENGEIGVAIIGDEATVKRIYDEGAQWRLQPENPAMKPLLVKKGERLFRIAGKVIGVIRKI
jgi:repressor LexA